MSARAQTIYGASLPPEWEGSTKGELRVRVDKLLLNDDAINRNPQVRLFKEDLGATAALDVPSPAGHRTAATSSTSRALVSPNRFVVPIDYCDVSPLFWGELQPSCHCQPATPGKPSRGAVSLVYPIKCSETEFVSYLVKMTESPHHGMQLEIYVPSNYSGRPPVHVGKSVVCLDALQPNRPISGWFTVAHYQRTPSGRPDPAGPLFIPVGKVKLHVQVAYFSEANAASMMSSMPAGVPVGNARTGSRHSSRDGDRSARHHSATRDSRSAHHEALDNSSAHTEKPFPAAAEATQMPAQEPTPTVTHTSTTMTPSQSTIPNASAGETLPESASVVTTGGSKSVRLQEVLRQGMALQAKMSQAVHDHLREDDVNAPSQPTQTQRRLEQQQQQQQPHTADDTVEVDLTPPPPLHALAPSNTASATSATTKRTPPRSNQHAVPRRGSSHRIEGDHDGDYAAGDVSGDSLYTSEASDEEQALLEAQQRTASGTASSAAAAAETLLTLDGAPATTPVQGLVQAQGQPTLGSRHTLPTAHTSVDLVFSDISFASTATTADLAEIRLQVRLSSDITTQTPASGPFSSYIHQLPFAQSAICLSFTVCGYSEETSKLVVEVFKVISRPRLVAGSTLLPSAPNAVREVVGEELLGLAIVGLYRQSRDIVLRDPVLDLSHVYSHLEVYLNGRGDGDAEAEAEDQMRGKQPAQQSANAHTRQGDTHGNDMQRYHDQAEEKLDDSHVRHSASYNDIMQSSHQTVPPTEETTSAMPRREGASSSQPLTPVASGYVSSRRASVKSQSGAKRSSQTSERPFSTEADHDGRSPQRQSVTYVTADSAQAAASGVTMIHPQTQGRCRLHLAIHSAKHIPLVKLVDPRRPSDTRGVALSRLESSELSEEELGRHGFTLPNAFFVVEDVLSGIDHGQPRTAPVAEWFVEEAVKGHFDRTAVAFASCSPSYEYESILSLPEEGVFLKQDITSSQGDGSDANTSQSRARPCLRELVLTLWHYAEPSAENIPRGASAEMEQQFWSKVAYVGECRVDLRSLRHMDHLNGYYRIAFTPTPPSIPHSTPVSSAKLDYTDADKTIGYVHLSVSLLGRRAN